MSLRPTTCRICESACGLVAEVAGDRVVDLRPDPDHPVSRGYACRKGTRFHEVHHGPGRLLRPRLDGADVTWPEALRAVGSRIRAVRDRHGPEAVGIYSGNAAGHALGAVLGVTALQRALGTTKHYSCLTLDNSGMFVVLEQVLGHAMRTFVADYAGSDCIVLVGTDPLSSQPSQAQSHPGGVRELRAARDRLWVIDPRSSDTARAAAHHLLVRPGTDVHLLAWLIREALDAGRTDPIATGAAALRPVLDAADPAHTGLAPETLGALRDALLAAERPLVWSGLGVLLGPQGTVGYWLTLVLQAVLGGLDRPGGWLQHRGAVDVPRLFGRLGVRGWDPDLRSRIGGYRAVLGTVAAATLADDVLTPGDGQLRALIVVGGNPLVSLPDSDRARCALEALEVLVCVDIRDNATTRLADAVLPACTWLARPEVAVHLAPQRRIPWLRRVDAVVPPVGAARDDYAILTDLARAAGRPPWGSRVLAAASRFAGPETIARAAVAIAGGVRWRALREGALATPGGGIRETGTPVRLDPPELLAALPPALEAPPSGALLVTSVRPMNQMNTWLQRGPPPTARAHPSRVGTLPFPAEADATLHPDAVVWPFGWEARNPNAWVHTRQLDPLTGQPVSNGLPISRGP